MATNTTNLNLVKPALTDSANIDVINSNMEILDVEVAKLATVNQDGRMSKEDKARLDILKTSTPYYIVATGSSNNYLYTENAGVFTNYYDGLALAVKVPVDNTGVSTININSLGAKAIKRSNGNDVSAGMLKANSIITVRYNGTVFILQGEGGVGDAQPNHVLSGKKFTNDTDYTTGTMPNRGTVNITPSTVNQTIQDGYHSGSGVVYGDSDLVASNIKTGVSIFGVSGNLIDTYTETLTLDIPAGYNGVITKYIDNHNYSQYMSLNLSADVNFKSMSICNLSTLLWDNFYKRTTQTNSYGFGTGVSSIAIKDSYTGTYGIQYIFLVVAKETDRLKLDFTINAPYGNPATTLYVPVWLYGTTT